MTRWKSEEISNLPQFFGSENSKLRKQAKSHEDQIGKLTAELSWLKKNWDITRPNHVRSINITCILL